MKKWYISEKVIGKHLKVKPLSKVLEKKKEEGWKEGRKEKEREEKKIPNTWKLNNMLLNNP